MPENIGGPSAPYNAPIPLLSGNADIQTALRLYHYGSDTNTPADPLPEDSIARHFKDLEDFKISKTPASILDAIDLDSFTESGFYIQESNSFAASGANYPSPNAGLLTILSTISEGTVFQQYQVIGAPESGSANTVNRTWWRSFFGGSWNVWRTFVDSGDFAAIGDVRYYTKTLSNALFYSQTYINSTFLTKADADLRLYLQENIQAASYTLALSDVNKVVAMNNSVAADLTVPNNTSVAFPVGSVINVYRMTDSEVTIVPADETVVIRNAGLIYQQYTEISLRKRAINEWVASGNIVPS
jgi:hypothetical protein